MQGTGQLQANSRPNGLAPGQVHSAGAKRRRPHVADSLSSAPQPNVGSIRLRGWRSERLVRSGLMLLICLHLRCGGQVSAVWDAGARYVARSADRRGFSDFENAGLCSVWGIRCRRIGIYRMVQRASRFHGTNPDRSGGFAARLPATPGGSVKRQTGNSPVFGRPGTTTRRFSIRIPCAGRTSIAKLELQNG